MAAASRRGKEWPGVGPAAWALALAVAATAGPMALAEETPQQFDAANAENRRHSEAQNQLRNDAHDLRNDQARALLGCERAGSAAAVQACRSNVAIDMRQRGLDLDNQIIRERNNHTQILKGIGVHRVP